MINNRKIAKTLAGLAGTLIVIVLAFLFSKFSPAIPQDYRKNNITADTTNISKVSSTQVFEVVRVVDGDTIVVKQAGQIIEAGQKVSEEKVRMIGVDTPEVVDPRKTVQCFGKQASTFTKNLLPKGTLVRLETDPSQDEYDKYNRLLAYIYIEDNSGLSALEKSINQTLIEQGYAHEYTYRTPYKYQAIFKKAEKEARLGKMGLWADDACAK